MMIKEKIMNISDSMKRALENKRRLLVGGALPSDADSERRIKNIESSAEASLSLFERGRSDSLFLGKMPEASGEMTREYSHIKTIAISFGTKGTKHYENSDVLDMLLYSLEWMYNNRYGENEILGKGWRDMRLFNWWDWEIGSPTSLSDTLVILKDHITNEDAKRYLSIFDKRVPLPKDYSSNKVHYAQLCITAALLEGDADRIFASIDAMKDTYEFSDGWKNDGQGFYTDGSYIFHTRHPMNGTYGIVHFFVTVELCRILKGTAFAKKEIEDKILFWAENSFLPFVSKCYAARGIMGRHPHNLMGSGLSMLSAVADASSLMMDRDREKCEYLFDIIARNLLTNKEMSDERIKSFVASVREDARGYLNAALKRAEEKGLRRYDLTKMFHNEDRAVHHFDNVSYALSLSSSRIYNYECINHENMEGWYLGDGMLTCIGADSYEYKDIWDHIDPYKLPLTTLDNREREKISISQRNEYLSGQDFVGGVEAPASLASAMILESYHGDGEHIDKTYFLEGGSQGGPPAKRDCTLRAKKGYFINGKIAVMLGAGISAHDGADVYTVVDSRRSENRARKISENALYLEGFGGYLILEGENKISRGGKDGSFEEIIIDHGINPEGEKYAFAYLPDFSEDEVRGFSENPVFEIISNTESLQAVKFADGTRSFVFYERGSSQEITVSEPLIITVKDGRLYLSDPTQKLERAVVSVGASEFAIHLKKSYGKTLTFEI